MLNVMCVFEQYLTGFFPDWSGKVIIWTSQLLNYSLAPSGRRMLSDSIMSS